MDDSAIARAIHLRRDLGTLLDDIGRRRRSLRPLLQEGHLFEAADELLADAAEFVAGARTRISDALPPEPRDDDVLVFNAPQCCVIAWPKACERHGTANHLEG